MSLDADIVRRGFDAFSRQDWDAWAADVDPEIEWHVTFELPDLPADGGLRGYRRPAWLS